MHEDILFFVILLFVHTTNMVWIRDGSISLYLSKKKKKHYFICYEYVLSYETS